MKLHDFFFTIFPCFFFPTFSGIFQLNVVVDSLFFIGTQLVALSRTGKIGVWHAMTQNWQVKPTAATDIATVLASDLLLKIK